MIVKLAEKISVYLTKNKDVNEDTVEMYTYGAEVLLLNLGILIVLFLISLIMGQLVFFGIFMVCFVPLRIFAGGWHASNSVVCFVVSVILYSLAMCCYCYIPNLYQYEALRESVVLFGAFIAVEAPVESENHPLSKKQRFRNMIITDVILLVEFIVRSVLIYLEMPVASIVSIAITLVAVLVFVASIERIINKKKSTDKINTP